MPTSKSHKHSGNHSVLLQHDTVTLTDTHNGLSLALEGKCRAQYSSVNADGSRAMTTRRPRSRKLSLAGRPKYQSRKHSWTLYVSADAVIRHYGPFTRASHTYCVLSSSFLCSAGRTGVFGNIQLWQGALLCGYRTFRWMTRC